MYLRDYMKIEMLFQKKVHPIVYGIIKYIPDRLLEWQTLLLNSRQQKVKLQRAKYLVKGLSVYGV